MPITSVLFASDNFLSEASTIWISDPKTFHTSHSYVFPVTVLLMISNAWQVLGKVEALRKKVVSVGKEHASICAKVEIYLYIYIFMLQMLFLILLKWNYMLLVAGILARSISDRWRVSQLIFRSFFLFVNFVSGRVCIGVLYKDRGKMSSMWNTADCIRNRIIIDYFFVYVATFDVNILF